MIIEYKKKSTYAFAVFILSAIGLAIYDAAIGATDSPIGYGVLSAICSISVIYACWALVKSKNRSGWWVLIIFPLSIIGILILFLLKDLSLNNET